MLTKRETSMFHALNWLVVLSLLALWSCGAWAFHAVASWTISNTDVLAGGAGAIGGLRLPDWLAPWLPPEAAVAFASMLEAFMPAVQAVLDQAPALAGGLSVAVWVVWGIGSILLVVLGLVVTGLIAMLRRRASVFVAPAKSPTAMS
jgi:hypothetical protein